MKTKAFKENIITGKIVSIRITQTREGSFISYYYRGFHDRYHLDRSFSSVNSALNFILKIIDIKPLEGLTLEYRLIPPIVIIKTFRRSDNETHQHEPQAEQQKIS